MTGRHEAHPPTWRNWSEEQRDYLDDASRRASLARDEVVDHRRRWQPAHRADGEPKDVQAVRPVVHLPVGPTEKAMHMQNLELGPAATDLLQSIIDAGFQAAVSVTNPHWFVASKLGDDFTPPDVIGIDYNIEQLTAQLHPKGANAMRVELLDLIARWRNRNLIDEKAYLIRWSAGIGDHIGVANYRYAERTGHPKNGAWIYSGSQISEDELIEKHVRDNPVAVMLTTEQEFVRSKS